MREFVDDRTTKRNSYNEFLIDVGASVDVPKEASVVDEQQV